MTANRDDQIADLVTSRATNSDLPRPDWVTDSEWDEITQLALIERELREGAVVPPLEQDRVAAMLGLIPDPAVGLNPSSLKRHRQRVGMSTSQLAGALEGRGWDTSRGDVFRWENQTAADVAPALIEAIAQVLGTSPSELTPAAKQERVILDARNPAIRALASRLAAALGIDEEMALSRLTAANAGSLHRGSRPEDDQLLATLDGYVRAMERRREP